MLQHFRGEHEIKTVGAEAIDQAVNSTDLVDSRTTDKIYTEIRGGSESFNVPAERAIHVP